MKCQLCGEIHEVDIMTHDITGNKGIVDQNKLEQRLQEPKLCGCGGVLRKHYHWQEPMFFKKLNGKISQRFL